MELVVFVLASAMVLAGALGVVLQKNPVHAALALVLTLFGIAVHFVALEAHFLAAVQVIVYAGAVVVLFLFVIMLLGVDKSEDLSVVAFSLKQTLAVVLGAGMAGLVIAAVVRGRDRLAEGTRLEAGGDSNIEQLARNLFSDHVFAFEFTAVLLIVAVAGTAMLTRRQKKGGNS